MVSYYLGAKIKKKNKSTIYLHLFFLQLDRQYMQLVTQNCFLP